MSRSAGSINVTTTLKLNGVDQKLKAVGRKLGNRILRSALRAVGKMWVSEVKSRVPIDTGDLHDSIKGKVRIKRGKGSVTVGPTWTSAPSEENPGLYGQFVELGTKVADYPMQPYLRPTFDLTSEKAVNMFVSLLQEELKDVNVASSGDSSPLFEIEEDIDDGGSNSSRGYSTALKSGVKVGSRFAQKAFGRIFK